MSSSTGTSSQNVLRMFHDCSFPQGPKDPWRYIVLFDENSPLGPFTADVIEPHITGMTERLREREQERERERKGDGRKM